MGKRGNVLVVDDDPSAGDGFNIVLGSEYEVSVAVSAASALESLRTGGFQTVVLEPWLAGVQGGVLLGRIRETAPQSRVIIVTGHRLSLWFDDTVRDEVFDYLPKPFEPRELLRSVRRSMVRHSGRPGHVLEAVGARR